MFPLAGFFVPYIVGMIVLKHLLAGAKKKEQGEEPLIKSEGEQKKPSPFAMAMYILGILALVAEMTILPQSIQQKCNRPIGVHRLQ